MANQSTLNVLCSPELLNMILCQVGDIEKRSQPAPYVRGGRHRLYWCRDEEPFAEIWRLRRVCKFWMQAIESSPNIKRLTHRDPTLHPGHLDPGSGTVCFTFMDWLTRILKYNRLNTNMLCAKLQYPAFPDAFFFDSPCTEMEFTITHRYDENYSFATTDMCRYVGQTRYDDKPEADFLFYMSDDQGIRARHVAIALGLVIDTFQSGGQRCEIQEVIFMPIIWSEHPFYFVGHIMILMNDTRLSYLFKKTGITKV